MLQELLTACFPPCPRIVLFIILFLNLSASGFLRALCTSEKFCRLLQSFSAIRSSTTETVCLGSVMRFDALLWHVFAGLLPLLLLCRILVCVADRRTLEDEQRLW